MVHEFKLPDVGEGVAEGELVDWLVAVGDEVTEDQPLAEVETDKALVEIPSPVDGTVRELRAEAGEMVPVGDVFITFDVAGEEGGAAATGGEAPGTEAAAGAAAEADEAEPGGEPAGGASAGSAGRVFTTPSVRRLSRELGVDLAAVAGSGPGGRVTEADVRAAAGGGEPAAEATTDEGAADAAGGGAAAGAGSPAAPGAPTGGEPGPSAGAATGTAATAVARERTLAAPATRQLARELGVDLNAVPAVEEREGEAFVTPEAVEAFAESGGEAATGAGAGATAAAIPAGGEERVPYRGLRRTIGEQMERSAFTVPHVAHHELLDAQPLVEARATLKPHAEERGIRLTYLPFVMKALVAALGEFPYLNASLDEDAEEIVLKGDHNIGFAAATDAGLLVPVVKQADGKGLLQLASEVNELAEKARDRSIAREEMQGGTFTVTNFGAVGGDYGTPIINYPEVAILGLGAIKDRPFVVDGEVVARKTLPVSLSIDHRVIDGAKAAAFVAEFAKYVENPTLLLLD